MHTTFTRLSTLLAVATASLVLVTQSLADPLPGQVLKFEQLPMVTTAYGGAIYFGHDEFSTAYGVGTAASPPQNYDGRFMADDFADNFSSPVVHLTWWGSYMNNPVPSQQPQVQKFLIAFESDIPATPGGFSQPGTVLQYDVVTLTNNPLPAQGQFTEAPVNRPAGDPLNEPLFKYNAELNLGHEFLQQKDTVYWLKIAALVDVPTPISLTNIPPGVTQWGWHNRDYTIQNLTASPNVTTFPNGEHIDGAPVSGQNVWHFQDDSVEGGLRFTPGALTLSQIIVQTNPQPQNYVHFNLNGVGPIDGPAGIELKSKDLAFRLYTTPQTIVPEPAACLLMAVGLAGVFATRRRPRST